MSGKIEGRSENNASGIFLSLGSNLGDRLENLNQAICKIELELGPVVKSSSVYESDAWGKTDQSDFLNQVIQLETSLSPIEILTRILQIESVMGRKRLEKWGPRLIDIDLLFYNDQIINDKDLILPHPEIQNRRFVLDPLAEIASDFLHPVFKKPIIDLSKACDDMSKVVVYTS